MKIFLTKPRDHWISPYTLFEKIFFWKKVTDYDDPVVVKWAERLTPVSIFLQKILNIIHPEVKYVKIDQWDTWSMDHTLSPIIHRMLVQLNNAKHGAPNVEDEDVPEHIRSTNALPRQNAYEVDSNHFQRWEWVMKEMIWTFEQLSNWDNDGKFYEIQPRLPGQSFEESLSRVKVDYDGLNAHHERINNGLRLFGKYYRSLWD